MDTVHVPRNAHVPSTLAEEAEGKCAAMGITSFDQRDTGEDWRRYVRLVRDPGLAGWIG